MLLRNRVKAFDNYNELGIEPTEINIKKCIKYIARAWNNVSQATINNCWLKADILPKNKDDEDGEGGENDKTDEADRQIYLAHVKELDEIQELIDRLDFDNPMTADEYIKYDDLEITTDMIPNEEILRVVLPDSNVQEKEDDDLQSLPEVSHSEAIEAYDKVIIYLEQQERIFNMKHEELRFIKKLKKEALKQQFISARQTNLDSFVNIIS